MSAKPRYLYFNARARGELPRLICAATGIDYIDERLEDSVWESKYKSKTPYGQIPVVEIDGKLYAQKLAISLYFARKGGLYPTNASPLDLLKIDHALLFSEEILEDYVSAMTKKYFHNEPEPVEKVKAEIFPQKLPRLEKLLRENGTGYYVGNQLTIVDLSAFDVTEHVVYAMGQEYLNSFPLIKAHFEKVGQLDGIKKYVASRPPSQYVY
ncbi:hypothetical protein BsWGS_12030 [Bradybaena similaris]